jgi:GTP cyclohydrolase I
VGVVIEARHTCMTQRGVLATESDTVTSTMLGTIPGSERSSSR